MIAHRPIRRLFDRNPGTGALTQKSNADESVACFSQSDNGNPIDEDCAPAVGLGGARGVAISPDGTTVYVASQLSAAVAAFNRNTATGDLTPAGCIADSGSDEDCDPGAGLAGANDVAVSPDGRSVYVTTGGEPNPFGGDPVAGADGVAIFIRDPATGELTQPDGNPESEGPGCVASSDGICLDGTALDGANGVVVSPDNTNIYVTAEQSGALAIFNRDPETGALTQPDEDGAGCIASTEILGCADGDGLTSARAVAISPDGHSVYVGSGDLDSGGGTVALFTRDATSGFLAQPDDEVEFFPAVFGVTVSPDGTSVYAAVPTAGIAVLARDTATGVLTFADCVSPGGGSCKPATAIAGISALAGSPDGRNLYGAAFLGAVSIFDRDPAPALYTAITPIRALDTRNGTGGVTPGQKVTTGDTILQILGRNGVPLTGVSAVAINITVTQPDGPGHIIAYPTGTPRPNTSNLNYTAGQTVANSAIVRLGHDGSITLFNFTATGGTHLIVDIVGYYT